MAKNFVWDYEAAGAVFLKSEEIASACEAAAERMSRATGVTYKTGATSQRVVAEPEVGDDE